MIQDYKMFINGKWKKAKSGKSFEVFNPATNEAIARVPFADEQDVDEAVKVARDAFKNGPWRKMNGFERKAILGKISMLIEKRKEELASLETLNSGKPITESINVDLFQSSKCFDYFASIAVNIQGQTIPVMPGDFFDYVVREPIGVIGQITPWNFPLQMASWKIAPALAAGNVIVIKPASFTPLTTLVLGEILEEAGLPAGVVNIITGSGNTAGKAIIEHPDIDKIAFTGSTEVGSLIMQGAAKNIKRISLELGGKSANIVFDDADIEEAVHGALFAAFLNQGENCIAGSRLLLHKSIHDKFVRELVSQAIKIKVGPGINPETQMGAIVSREQQKKIEDYIRIGIEEGAKLIIGGKRPEGKEFAKGNFLLPTIFDNVNNKMRIAQEEIFGPVLSIIPFSTEEEAVEIANDTVYGLAGAIWTKDIKRAHNIAMKLRSGTVYINTYNYVFTEAPFGGYKQSGLGRELGTQAIEEYTEVKNVVVDLNKESINWYESFFKKEDMENG